MLSLLLYRLLLPANLLLPFLEATTEWDPDISWNDLFNGSVLVKICPPFSISNTAYYEICMKNNNHCYGYASEYKKYNGTVVYVVSELDVRNVYEIWVMPRKGDETALLTKWRICKSLVKLTTSSPVSGTVTEAVAAVTETKVTGGGHDVFDPHVPVIYLHVPIILTVLGVVTLLLLGVICAVIAVKTGYLTNVFPWLWFHCYRQQPIDVLLLYLHEEGSHFTKFVEAHAQHIGSFVSCNFIDSSKLRQKYNPYEWLISQVVRCHVLIYVSPLLLQYLYREVSPHNNPYHEKIVRTVSSLTELKRRGRAMFVLSGCGSVGTEAASKLTEMFKLPCHVAVRNESAPGRKFTLSSSLDLFTELLSAKTCPGHACCSCIDSTSAPQALLEAVQKLWDSGPHIREITDDRQDLFGHHAGLEEENEILMPVPRQLLEHSMSNLIVQCADRTVSCINSDLSSSSSEGADEMDLLYRKDNDKADVDSEIESFIEPDEPFSHAGSELSIEERLRMINKRNSGHWH